MKTFLILSAFIAVQLAARAHPVAQGALDLQVLPEKLLLQARISGEEIFVADTFGTQRQGRTESLDEVWQAHGRYLLQHLKVFADGDSLTGRLLQIEPLQNDFVRYQFQFNTVVPPKELHIEEDVLREIQYAPGNQWEASYICRIRQIDQLIQEGTLLSVKEPLSWTCDWQTTPKNTPKTNLAGQYIRHGIDHILTGYDHLLFIIALVLATKTFWDLLKVVTAFTLAHTVTLALSVLNILRLPSSIVEPMIAGSIVFVALTNVFWPERSRGRTRLATAFFFGLFHGLGFAGGLLSATQGMTGVPVFIAIAAFSLGVELGHQTIVLPFFAGLKLVSSARGRCASADRLSLNLTRAGSLFISLAGAIYLIAALR